MDRATFPIGSITQNATLEQTANAAVLTQTGDHIIVASDERIMIWSIKLSKDTRILQYSSGDDEDEIVDQFSDVSISFDNQFLAATAYRCVRIWDISEQSSSELPICRIERAIAITHVSFGPRLRTNYLLLGLGDGHCELYTGPSFTLSRVFAPPNSIQYGEIYSASFSYDAEFVAAGTMKDIACIWRADHPEEHYILRTGSDGSQQRSAAHFDERCDVTIVEFKNYSWMQSTVALLKNSVLTCFKFNASVWVKSSSSTGWTKLLSLINPTSQSSPATYGSIKVAVWASDGCHVIGSSTDSTICIWNAMSGDRRIIRRLVGHSSPADFIHSNPRYPIVAVSGGPDGKVIFWNLHRGRSHKIFALRNLAIIDGSFSADGTCFFLLDSDRKVKIFELLMS